MRDFAISDDPAVQAQLDRLGALTLPQGRFGLETISELLARLDNPQHGLPPTFHVAGTNGKGSTCAYLRAMLEAEGYRVHAATKPHLVRYNERIRVAGKLIEDNLLAALLEEVLDAGAGLDASFFEVTAAAAFLAFARIPADACIIEVGLGGRLDATNVLERPAACGIASLGIDHEAFLLRPEEGVPTEPRQRIAFEKASIARAGAPLVTQAYARDVARVVARTAHAHRAELFMRGHAWGAEVLADHVDYHDCYGPLRLPLPFLAGAHQADNAALAVAMLRHQNRIAVSPEAMARGIIAARWPGRLQQLGPGPLTERLPGRAVWVDGAHNADAAEAVARAMAPHAPIDLMFGLARNRRVADVLFPFAPLVRECRVVPLPGHDHHDPRDIAMFAQAERRPAETYPDFSLEQALDRLAARGTEPRPVLIAGSLYLVGEALKFNRELPD